MENEALSNGNALRYFVLDVFAGNRLEGNPLAVFLNPGTLSDDAMQAIARETNLSETTFIERRDAATENREGVRVRIFTTQEELPFAGHPTLGTASLLAATAPETLSGDTVSLALKVGKVPVRFPSRSGQAPGSGEWPLRGEMTQRDPEFGGCLDPAEVARLTGLAVDDLDPALPPQIVSTGMPFALVPLRSSAALPRLRVRQDEAPAFLKAHGARWFYVLGPTGATEAGEPAWRARMQFHGGEDPATGSAAGCAIGLLVRYGAVPPDRTLHLRQGVEIHRPSDIFLTASLNSNSGNQVEAPGSGKVSRVRVGGSTILVAKGELFLP